MALIALATAGLLVGKMASLLGPETPFLTLQGAIGFDKSPQPAFLSFDILYDDHGKFVPITLVKAKCSSNYLLHLAVNLKNPKISNQVILNAQTTVYSTALKIDIKANKTLYEQNIDLKDHKRFAEQNNSLEVPFVGFNGKITQDGKPVDALLSLDVFEDVKGQEHSLTLLKLNSTTDYYFSVNKLLLTNANITSVVVRAQSFSIDGGSDSVKLPFNDDSVSFTNGLELGRHSVDIVLPTP